MNIPCPQSSPCIDPSTPVTNFSTEAPDPPSFISLQWPPFVMPDNPVGGGPDQNQPPNVWNADGCQSQCTSTVSQAAADSCALAQAQQCIIKDSGQTSYCNDPESCSAACPDGTLFTFTVPACTINATTKAAANDQAKALACSLLHAALVCPGCGCNFSPDFLPQGSLGVPYSAQFSPTTCLPGPFSWQVTSGSLPPGLTLNEQTGALTGTPTSTGSFAFTITLQNQAT